MYFQLVPVVSIHHVPTDMSSDLIHHKRLPRTSCSVLATDFADTEHQGEYIPTGAYYASQLDSRC